MNILTTIWSMVSAACGMLGLLNIFLWINSRRDRTFLLSAVMAFSVAVNAFIELRLFSANTTSSYQYFVLWESFLVALVLVPMVWFIYEYFGTARRWIAIAISALWGASEVINFALKGTLTFTEVTGLKTMMTFWGEPFTVPEGIVNPLSWLANLASFLTVIYIVEASIRLWRKGIRQRAAFIGGSILLFILFAGIHTPLVDLGIIRMPYMVSFAFLFIVMAQTYSLTYDAVKVQRLTDEIRVNEERWRNLMANVQLAAVALDGDGRITFINSHMEWLLGYSQEELTGEPMTTILSHGEISFFEERMSQARLTGPRPHSRWTLVAKSGEERILDWSSVELRGPDGIFTGILSLGLDVTDRLKSEFELGRLQRDLAHLSRVTSIGELTSSLAHELNQPLAAILSNAQAAQRFLASDKRDLDEISEILDDIIQDDKRAGKVISSLRALLRREKQVVESFDLGAAIIDVVGLLKSELTIRNIRLDMQLAENARVRFGRIEIRQVIMNLMMNALQAMKDTPPSSRSITVRTTREDGFVMVSVRDSGSGITEEILHSMFEPFQTTKSEGLGIGLSISQRVVEKNGGRIWAENNDDGGATFNFTLPYDEGEVGNG